jgi:hypothetical protein
LDVECDEVDKKEQKDEPKSIEDNSKFSFSLFHQAPASSI